MTLPTVEQNAMKPVADQVLAERVLVTLKRVQESSVLSPGPRGNGTFDPFRRCRIEDRLWRPTPRRLYRNTEAAGGTSSLPQLPRPKRPVGQRHRQNGRLA